MWPLRINEKKLPSIRVALLRFLSRNNFSDDFA
jgi:hypothetical protein